MEEKLKPIKIIHLALCFGVAIAYAVLVDFKTLEFLNFNAIETTDYIFILVPVAAILLGNFLYTQQLKSADKNLKLEEKIGVYQTAMLIRLALLEGAAFFILFIKKELIILGLFLIFYMLFLRPSENAMKRDFDAVK